jgi:hypothetical protein
MNQERPIKILQALVILLLCFPPPLRAATGDDFIRGYASAVLEREFGLKNFSLNGAREAVTVTSGELTPADYDKVIAALSSIDGVKRVLIFDSRGVEVATSSAQSSAAQRSMAERLPAEYEVGFLPGGNLFEPLIADPRWPRFSIGYRYFPSQSRNVASTTFGERSPFTAIAVPLMECGRSAFRPAYFRSLTWTRNPLIWLTATF